MTQPLDINKLARETAQKAVYLTQEDIKHHILAALTKLAAEKDAEIARHKVVLKVAKDALDAAYHAFRRAAMEGYAHDAKDALAQIEKEIKP